MGPWRRNNAYALSRGTASSANKGSRPPEPRAGDGRGWPRARARRRSGGDGAAEPGDRDYTEGCAATRRRVSNNHETISSNSNSATQAPMLPSNGVLWRRIPRTTRKLMGLCQHFRFVLQPSRKINRNFTNNCRLIWQHKQFVILQIIRNFKKNTKNVRNFSLHCWLL